MAESALRNLLPSARDRILSQQGQMPSAPAQQSMSMVDRARRFASLDTPQDMSLGETLADIGMGFAPGIGTAQGVRDFERARRDDDLLGMALGGISVLPLAGGLVKAGRAAGEIVEGFGDAASRAVRSDPLDMSAEARMQRAAEQGFNVDMPVYHGTGEDFLEFDPLKIGKTDEGWFGQGFYFSPIPEIANQYAAGRSPNVQQVYLRAKNPYDWRKNEGASLRLGTAEERYAKTKEILEKGYDAVDVYSDRIKIGQDEILPDNVFLAIVQRAQRLGDPVMPRAMIEQALKSGMDYHDFARRYGNDIASMMPVKKTLMEQVVFDPANIRSVNAAFDPANRRSANILATAAGGTIGLSALRQLMPQEEERPIE